VLDDPVAELESRKDASSKDVVLSGCR
jgi:hypothetical protein